MISREFAVVLLGSAFVVFLAIVIWAWVMVVMKDDYED
jgi:hypothetical protein